MLTWRISFATLESHPEQKGDPPRVKNSRRWYEPVAQGGLIAIGLVAVALLMLSLVQRRWRAKHRLATTDLKRRLDGPEDILVLDVRDRAD